MFQYLSKKRNQKGFTLIEMLIVVAIIAILVAIAVPTFSSQLEKSRVATDKANMRTAMSLAVSDYMLEHQDATSPITFNVYQDTNGNLSVQATGVSCTQTVSGNPLKGKSNGLTGTALTIDVDGGKAIPNTTWADKIKIVE